MRVTDILTETSLRSLDAEVLLAHALGTSREWLLSHATDTVTDAQVSTWKDYEQRRLNHEPVAYITGTKEFYGRRFIVTPDVLIPRPATEGLVESVLTFLDTKEESCTETDTDIVAGCMKLHEFDNTPLIVEVGTGSGCIAITLKLERPDLRIIASDISSKALAVAKQNASALHADIECREGDGLVPFSDIAVPFLLVSNPPYIPVSEPLSPNVVDYEPVSALFSGNRGMDMLKTLTTDALHNPYCIGLCYECKATQWEEVRKWA